ncbi:glycosyltransferase family 4 protein [Ktedonospora formicarum]|uniref:Glycosyl transferase n=1 Tax=Ktedonospora formicarum TaxID=2778364 RepID=A0A8J3MSG5_9CHLR|nr:glycosyltransferase family 4 protein [Ktedonospora formicarum]GHO43310.1 glycosyl transferase [Ktedonospora formicarum]
MTNNKTRLKIAQIAPPWISIPPENYGGTEAVLSNLVEELVAQGHDVTLYAPGDSQTSARHISFYPQALLNEGTPWQAHLKAYFHLHKALQHIQQEDNYDIVHGHLSSMSDMYLLPLLASLTIPHVITMHSHMPFDRVGDWHGDADNYFFYEWGHACPLVTISRSACRVETGHAPLNALGVVYNGINMREYEIPEGTEVEPYFVWLGRFSPEKGAHHAIKVAQRAEVPLYLAGTVDNSSEEAERYFREEIEPHFDDAHVRYLGALDLEGKRKVFSRASGFLNPIEWEEPFGMVMVEAMALGCPVITFGRGAAPEVVSNGVSGFVVDDLDGMIEAIPRVSKLDRAQVREHVSMHFSANAMANAYMNIYRQLIPETEQSERCILPTNQPS